MADVLPVNFPIPSESLVNYDFTDLLTGVGYINLYCTQDEADAYIVSRLAVAAAHDNYETRKAAAGGAYISQELEFDYTMPINQLIKGDLFVTCTHNIHVAAADAGVGYIKCRIYHYDGSTETEIGTQQSTTEIGGSPADFYSRDLFKFSVNKKFVVGDILRINFELWINSANGNTYCSLFHDGISRDFGQEDPTSVPVGSNILVQVPFDMRGKL